MDAAVQAIKVARAGTADDTYRTNFRGTAGDIPGTQNRNRVGQMVDAEANNQQAIANNNTTVINP